MTSAELYEYCWEQLLLAIEGEAAANAYRALLDNPNLSREHVRELYADTALNYLQAMYDKMAQNSSKMGMLGDSLDAIHDYTAKDPIIGGLFDPNRGERGHWPEAWHDLSQQIDELLTERELFYGFTMGALIDVLLTLDTYGTSMREATITQPYQDLYANMTPDDVTKAKTTLKALATTFARMIQ
jgi:hypothetical protein